LIILADDEGVNEDGEVVVLEAINDEEREIEDLECKAIGLFALTDTSDVGVRTMKLEGFVQGASVLVLIDSGATHNFISPTVVEALGLPITNTKPMGVRLGDGHRIMTFGKCEGVKLEIGNVHVTVEAYVLGLGGC
jgi:hypothetical protein